MILSTTATLYIYLYNPLSHYHEIGKIMEPSMGILPFATDLITKDEITTKILMLLNLVNVRSTIRHMANKLSQEVFWHYGVHISSVWVFIKSLEPKDEMMYSLLCMYILSKHQK